MILDLFGGPGGWAEGARLLGLAEVGFELDAAACATRAAAGHRTVRTDVGAFPVDRLHGVSGLVASPPCTTFSAAGKRAGTEVTDALAELVADMFAGRATRKFRRHAMVAALRAGGWPPVTYRSSRYARKHKTRAGLSRAERSEARWRAVRSASLVAEPARFIAACAPEWVALEQVPSVLPLWQVYAAELGRLGYSAWCGVLNAADYGVPQTRERAILIASRSRRVSRPGPTHYDPRKGDQFWGARWVSMADALGWGATGRPVPTVTSGGTSTGGAEPFGHRDRDTLETERDAGRWVLRTNSGNGDAHDYERETRRPSPAVAPRADRWLLRMDTQDKATLPRSPGEPAPTIQFAHRANLACWVRDRPSTTVLADPRIGRPGHKGRENGGESHFAVDSVRITPEEAAALQSFPPGYPFQGSKTKRFEQIGNAVPPLLAAHVLAMATGRALPAAEAGAA